MAADFKMNASKFKRLNTSGSKFVTLIVEGQKITAYEGDSVAVALLASDANIERQTPVTGDKRAPYCMMGVCFECLVEINGIPNQQGCMVPVKDGMRISRQLGARDKEVGDD